MGSLGCRHQCLGISLQQVRIPGIAQDDSIGLFVDLTTVDNLDGGHQCAVMEYLRVRRSDATRPGATQVPKMGEGMAIGHYGSFMKHRRYEHHVRGVSDAALGDVWVVVPVQVPLLYGILRVVLPDTTHDVTAHGVAVYLMTPSVQEADGVIFLLTDERRHRSAFDNEFALESCGPERTSYQLARHRVNGEILVGLAGCLLIISNPSHAGYTSWNR